MKKLGYTILILTLSLLIMTYFVARPASAAADFDAYMGATIADVSIDGSIGSEWNDAGHYTNVAIDPSGTAEIWTKNDGTYIYIAFNFTADSNNPWVALQLAPTGCMTSGADGALLGDDNFAANGYRDIRYGGPGNVATDATQNGVGAITVGAGNVTTIELKKPLNSTDILGGDIAWVQGNQYNLLIAWDSISTGASGGTTDHMSGGTTARTILIDPNQIPEFPGLAFIVVFLVAMLPVIFLARKMIPKVPSTRRV